MHRSPVVFGIISFIVIILKKLFQPFTLFNLKTIRTKMSIKIINVLLITDVCLVYYNRLGIFSGFLFNSHKNNSTIKPTSHVKKVNNRIVSGVKWDFSAKCYSDVVSPFLYDAHLPVPSPLHNLGPSSSPGAPSFLNAVVAIVSGKPQSNTFLCRYYE